MKSVIVLLGVCLVGAQDHTTHPNLSGQDLVDYINSLGLWKAKLSPRFKDMDVRDIKALMGYRKSKDANPVRARKTVINEDIPAEFDSATNWPECKDVILNVPDQSNCGSCWAVSSTSVMSDRLCIASKGKKAVQLSAAYTMECFPGLGCDGGVPDMVFDYWTDHGVCTGGAYGTNDSCMPYPFPKCEHHVNKTHYPACKEPYPDAPTCKKVCQKGYKAHSFEDDLVYGSGHIFYGGSEKAIQQEILKNGSVTMGFVVYNDFLHYSSGVYQHVAGRSLGRHAVRCIGWGVEDGKPYWKIVNSWNEDWGDKGFVKILRGSNEVGIEDNAVAANPKL